MSVDSLLTPLPLLLSAHAGADASRHRAIWAFDAQLAKVARTTRERAIGQMRLAWWNDVIDDPAGIKGQGEPVVDALRATGGMAAPGLVAMIDGWEVLVVAARLCGRARRRAVSCSCRARRHARLAGRGRTGLGVVGPCRPC